MTNRRAKCAFIVSCCAITILAALAAPAGAATKWTLAAEHRYLDAEIVAIYEAAVRADAKPALLLDTKQQPAGSDSIS